MRRVFENLEKKQEKCHWDNSYKTVLKENGQQQQKNTTLFLLTQGVVQKCM